MLKKLEPLLTFIFGIFADINMERIVSWFRKDGKYYNLTDEDWTAIRDLVTPNYYFILTRRRLHLTTYLIEVASKITTKKTAFWSHALGNVDDGSGSDLKFIEATKIGVHFSPFEKVFDCDAVVLLEPLNLTQEEWVRVIDAMLSFNGRKYDNLFDLTNDEELSCIEVLYQAIRLAKVEDKFPHLMQMVKKVKNIAPEMLYGCPDLKIAFEVRR